MKQHSAACDLDLDRVRSLARDLARDLARPGSLDVWDASVARGLARDLADDLERGLAGDLEPDLERSLVFARDLARDLSDDLDRITYDPYRDPYRDPATNFGMSPIDPDPFRDRAVRLAEDRLARDHKMIIGAVETCGRAASQPARSLRKTGPDAAGHSTGRLAGRPPGRTTRTLTTVACRLLPADHRSRYTEEFYAELFELPRRHRIAHAVRVLCAAPAIRASLGATPAAGREVRS